MSDQDIYRDREKEKEKRKMMIVPTHKITEIYEYQIRKDTKVRQTEIGREYKTEFIVEIN